MIRGAGGGALLGAGIGALAGGAGAGAAIGAGVVLLPAASGVHGMHREYTITRTMNAWPVVLNGEMRLHFRLTSEAPGTARIAIRPLR